MSDKKQKSYVVAIAGNPNSGKTTIFNNLTGGRQAVGNYPGVTVEKRTGTVVHEGVTLEFIDLPGTYAMSSFSLDEKVAREYLLTEKPDIVLNVLDSSNLERHLYLSLQLLEMGYPLVMAFNMSDAARAHGLEFDIGLLERSFKSPIVECIGNKNVGTSEILDALVKALEEGLRPETSVNYGSILTKCIQKVEHELVRDEAFSGLYNVEKETDKTRWLALKLLEQDPDLQGEVTNKALLNEIKKTVLVVKERFADVPASVIADRRYGYISGACQEAVKVTAEIRHSISDKADTVITHRIFGIPIFLGLMYLVFTLTFKIGEPAMAFLEWVIGSLSRGINGVWPDGRLELVRSMLVEGVIGGVGGVIVFLPNIMLLFLAIAFLEYSGYMARAAFVTDRLMHRIGLHGKSFIPFLLGFGCSVPAIMATRTLDSMRNRIITMLVVPLISCGARLPIYALIIPAFFPKEWYSPMLLLMYVIGIVLAIAGAKVLGMTLLRGETQGLVIELPPYRMPTMRAVLSHTWERSWLYIKKAGTIILGISVIMWALNTFPMHDGDTEGMSAEDIQMLQLSNSISGRIGKAMEPVIRPMGFDWKIGTALIGAFAAKEVFVAQLGIINATGDNDSDTLRERLRDQYPPLSGFCMMLFCLIGFPCVATVAITRVESGRWKWALLQLGGLTGLAYVVTFTVYQLGVLLGCQAL